VRLREVIEALEAEVVLGEDRLDLEIPTGGGCDMISDLLFFGKPGMLLLTGLTQPVVVRTAMLMDMSAIAFVRGKRPDEDAVEAAREAGMPLLVTPHSLYDCCGRLYARGLPGVIAPRRRSSSSRSTGERR